MDILFMPYARAPGGLGVQGSGGPPPSPPGRGGPNRVPQSKIDLGKDETDEDQSEEESEYDERNCNNPEPSTETKKNQKTKGEFYCDFVDPDTGEPCSQLKPFTRNSNLNKHKVQFHNQPHRARAQWVLDVRAESQERRLRKEAVRNLSSATKSLMRSSKPRRGTALTSPQSSRVSGMPMEARNDIPTRVISRQMKLYHNRRPMSHQELPNLNMPDLSQQRLHGKTFPQYINTRQVAMEIPQLRPPQELLYQCDLSQQIYLHEDIHNVEREKVRRREEIWKRADMQQISQQRVVEWLMSQSHSGGQQEAVPSTSPHNHSIDAHITELEYPRVNGNNFGADDAFSLTIDPRLLDSRLLHHSVATIQLPADARSHDHEPTDEQHEPDEDSSDPQSL
ncbi:hypothetical protein QBC36DRAFT_352398 [Triangularia setosa]|uniref:Uncharacterized protein n=1 Tax=Triangularia setosa TaxID=2587417 RepID=A0AAN7A7T2_9PEZI|nr:hypothetical protein QBC36DRAFT_352398 [Podospora setosa]